MCSMGEGRMGAALPEKRIANLPWHLILPIKRLLAQIRGQLNIDLESAMVYVKTLRYTLRVLQRSI